MKLLHCVSALSLWSGARAFVPPCALRSAIGQQQEQCRSQVFDTKAATGITTVRGPKGRRALTPLCMTAGQPDFRATVVSWTLAAVLLVGSPFLSPSGAAAISGGGLDYSGLDLTGKDFSNGKYKSKDFSGAIAKEVSFKRSDLRGVRFFKADLKKADFTGANLGTASLEEADLDGAILTDAVATGSYFGNNMANIADISGADFTDALIRKDVAKALCGRSDAKGTNPTTGAETRDSLSCDMF